MSDEPVVRGHGEAHSSQVNVTEGGQAVVAGDKVTSRTRGRRRSGGGGMAKNER